MRKRKDKLTRLLTRLVSAASDSEDPKHAEAENTLNRLRAGFAVLQEKKSVPQAALDMGCQSELTSLRQFVVTGESSVEYTKHLDECPKCQTAVRLAFDALAERLQRFGRIIRGQEPMN